MPAAEAAEDPVSPPEAAELLNPLRFYRHVALAVSGGGDSMALMWLATEWAKHTQQPPRLTVLTVDHGLRAASAREAAWVIEQARALGLAAEVLQWHGEKPTTGVQARAREARYDLLTGWCAANGAGALVTAHSLDDQAETVLMRLARGSGVDGLAGMRPSRQDRLAILRPLLGVSRVRLRSTLAAAGLAWIEDPSNRDPRYERVRWRNTLAGLAQEGLAPAMIALSARRLERARQALEHATSRLEDHAVAHEAEHATFRLAAVQGEPEELVVRLLRRLIMRYGTGGEAPELAALERLSAWMSDGVSGGRTLAGCRISRRKDAVRISRAPPRRQA
ncbi:MAG: tRNA lysidine(34) synthetase TilS [Hyphomicrobiales bacterium]